MFKKQKRGFSSVGFTLIELLVIVAIIGILTSIVVASLNQAKAKSRDERRLQDIAVLQLELENYYNKHNFYPKKLDDLVPDNLPFVPKDPSLTSADYFYAGLNQNSAGTGCRSYHLGAQLELPNALINSDSDRNVDSSVTTPSVTLCGESSGFNGAGQNVFDVRPKY